MPSPDLRIVRTVLAVLPGAIAPLVASLALALPPGPVPGPAVAATGLESLESGDVHVPQEELQRPPRERQADVDELLRQARQAGEDGHWVQALRLLVEATSREPGRADLQYHLGLVYEELSNLGNATEAYRRALEIDPAMAPAATNLASILLQRGDVEGAEHLLRRGLEHNPEDASLHYHLALLLFRRDQRLSEPAVQALERARDLGFHRPHLYLLLGRVARLSGEARQARMRLTLGLELAPDDPELQHERGIVEAELGNLEAAVEWLEQAFAQEPDDVELATKLAGTLVETERPERAISVLEEALSREPEQPDLLYALARAQRAAGDPDARATMQRFQELQQEQQEEQNVRARALSEIREGVRRWEEGDLTAAAERFEEALRIEPTQIVAGAYLAAAYLELGRAEQAERLARRVLGADPDNSQALLVLGRLKLEDSPEEAIGYLERAVDLYPYRVVCLLTLAEAYLDTGRVDLARELVERAAGLEPDHPWVEELRRRLQAGVSAPTSPPDDAPGPLRPR